MTVTTAMTFTTEAELKAQAEKDGIEFFFAMFVDMHGKPCAKMVPVEAFDQMMGGGAGFAGFAAGPDGPDARPTPTSSPCPTRPPTRRCPGSRDWRSSNATSTSTASPWPYSPRVILKRIARTARASAAWSYNVGAEAEYFLVRRGPARRHRTGRRPRHGRRRPATTPRP